jgi:hypothetical protein
VNLEEVPPDSNWQTPANRLPTVTGLDALSQDGMGNYGIVDSLKANKTSRLGNGEIEQAVAYIAQSEPDSPVGQLAARAIEVGDYDWMEKALTMWQKGRAGASYVG